MNRKTTYEHLSEAGDLSEQTFGDWPVWRHTVPFPTPLMMGSSGTHLLETYLVVGAAWSQMLSHYLPDDANILDIGCGCAKVARFFAADPRVSSYIGFDPIASCIKWNNRFVVPVSGQKFKFLHVDLYSSEYNPHGTIAPCDLAFPAEKNSIDLCIASSVFTHLLEHDARHYLSESFRVLKAGGRLVLSLHTEPAGGASYAGDEARIDVDPAYFISIAEEHGLQLEEALGSFCGQDVFVFRKRAA